jgi:hypothetical protein
VKFGVGSPDRKRFVGHQQQGAATMNPKDYRTPFEKAHHKAYVQYKLDVATADEVFNKAVGPLHNEYEQAIKPIRKAFDEAVKPFAHIHDDASKRAKEDYKKAKAKAKAQCSKGSRHRTH